MKERLGHETISNGANSASKAQEFLEWRGLKAEGCAETHYTLRSRFVSDGYEFPVV